MLILLGRRHAFNMRKVLWLLDEPGLENAQEDWRRGHRSTDDPQFLALDPLGTAPVLLDGDAVIRETQVILRCLASRQSAWALYPQGLVARGGGGGLDGLGGL